MIVRKLTLLFSVACIGFLLTLASVQSAQADSHSDPESFMNHYLQTFDTGHIWEITPLYNDPFYMMAPSCEVKIFEGEKKYGRFIYIQKLKDDQYKLSFIRFVNQSSKSRYKLIGFEITDNQDEIYKTMM